MNHRGGFLVTVGNDKGLVRAMTHLWDRPEKVRRIVEEGQGER